jgi:aldose 1-epimerase
VQIYTGNFIAEERGKGGVIYNRRQGICFETQYYPDALNHANFPSSLCKAGQVYKTTTAYRFL